MHRPPRPDALSRAGFTILEVATVIVIIAILSVMAAQAYSSLRGKAERASCVNNLTGLYAAASAYVTDQGQWPQISTRDVHQPAYAEAWIAALSPYGISGKNWICNSVQYALKGHDYAAYPRVDYLAMPFGPEPRAAYQWANQPWFVERGDMHGDGNLMVFTSGQVKSLQDFRRDVRAAPREVR